MYACVSVFCMCVCMCRLQINIYKVGDLGGGFWEQLLPEPFSNARKKTKKNSYCKVIGKWPA